MRRPPTLKPVTFRGLAPAIPALAALILVAGACGSTTRTSTPTTQAGTSSAATSGSGGAATTQGVTANSITVGGVDVVNGQGYSYADVCNGAQVLFKKVNAAGGVNGRTIHYVGCLDDGGSSGTDNAQTTRLVESDRVFAIVPASILFTGSSVAVNANVPYFGWGISPYFCNNSQGFGFNGCTGPTNPNWTDTSWATMIKKALPNVTTVGIQSLDIPPTHVTSAAAVKGFAAEGLKLVYQDGSIPLTGVADYTPYVQKIIAANPQVLVLQVQTPVPLISALRAAGYKGATLDAVDDSAQLLSNPSTARALEGAYVVTSFSPDPNNAGMQQMRADAKQYGTANQVIDDSFAQGYFSAAMFIDMVQKAGRDLTSTSFYKVANNSGYCFDGNGAMGSVCYPTGHTDYTGCVALVQIKNSTFAPTVPITCSTGIGNNASQKSS